MKSKLQSSGRWSDPVAVIIDPLFSIFKLDIQLGQ